MQQDAINRVREMQRRAQNLVGGENGEQKEIPAAPPHEITSAPKPLFQGIKIDEEKALIALLIYVLYKNKADMKLLLGLGYLLL
jgi:hypothetical protein